MMRVFSSRTWAWHNPVRVVSGLGCRRELAHSLSGTVVLLTSSGMLERGTARSVMALCPSVAWQVHTVTPNPDAHALVSLAETLDKTACRAVVALGGGSVLDAAKVLAPLLRVPKSDVLHAWLRTATPEVPAGVPVFCLPTTAGTGAEVTPFATVWDTQEQKKYSLAHVHVLPHAVFLDPELTVDLPWVWTLYTALDTLSHALESLWNKNATPVSVPLACEALRLVVEALPIVETAPGDVEARARLQHASLLAGYAISQTRTAIAHSMSYPLTAHFGVPHGLACGYTLASIMLHVEHNEGWAALPEQALRDRVFSLLNRYAPHEHVFSYCSGEQVCAKLDEMITPSRSGNFTLEVTPEVLAHIVKRALHLAV